MSFVALHAIPPDQFSGMYVQLLTALGIPPLPPSSPPCHSLHTVLKLMREAIARERRIQMRMKERAVQGFVTDGVLYRFMQIGDAGKVCTPVSGFGLVWVGD